MPKAMIIAGLIAGLPVMAQCQAQGSSAQAAGPAPASPQPASREGVVRADTVVSGLEHPWGLEFLPDGRMIVTERPGRIRVVERDGRLSAPLAGVPAVNARQQGGLLDIAVDPNFAQNRLVYFSYAEPAEDGSSGTAVARARLGDGRLENLQVIYRQEPKVRTNGHYGSRIIFARDGKLFITQGDRFTFRDSAQVLSNLIGKVVRINADGSVPRDNPFAGRAGARPEIWSIGHRSMQAAALHPETGQLWTVEHGARGGDELNHPEAGKNYGWPVITYGIDYSGAKIGEGTAREGMEQPVYYWDPVIAPSGLVFYTGDAFPGWKGSVLIGSMVPGGLVRLTMENGRVASEERYLGAMKQRFRDVKQGPDGLIYVITDHDNGSILRLRPAASR